MTTVKYCLEDYRKTREEADVKTRDFESEKVARAFAAGINAGSGWRNLHSASINKKDGAYRVNYEVTENSLGSTFEAEEEAKAYRRGLRKAVGYMQAGTFGINTER